MKRTASAIISTFVSLSVIVAASVNLAMANPGPLLPFPYGEPVTTPPTIVVYSPVQNQTYNSTDVWLNFTIIKPETWFPSGPLAEHYNAVFGNVTSVYYIVDDGGRQDITVHDTDTLFIANSPRTLNFSTLLTLAEGVHSLKVSLEADSYYVVQTDQGFTLRSIPLHGDSETTGFTVAVPESFPTVPVVVASGASAVAIAAGLVVYLRKRAHKDRTDFRQENPT
jgi:hypothetical protein